MATPQQVIEVAASQIGISGTNNKFNQWYWGHPCYDAGVYPWCAAFQSWVADQVGGLGYSYSASVSGICNQLVRVADEDARPGDYVMFNWDGRSDTGWADHIGLIEWSDITGSGYFGTIEGNTDGAAGGLCARRTRYNYTSYFTAFYRPVYDGVPAPTPNPSLPTLDMPQIKYRVYADGGWLPEMIDRHDTGGSSDTYAGNGKPIQYLAMDFPGWYQVRTKANGWLPRVYRYDVNDLENGCAGDGSDITGVRCYYDTPDPNKTGWIRIRYAVANVGGDFFAEMEDDIQDAYGDDYAGNGGVISAFYAYPVRI